MRELSIETSDLKRERETLRTAKREAQRCNGWRNYQTWNVALWIGNDEPLYRAAVEFMRGGYGRQPYKGRAPYRHFIESLGIGAERTPDRVKWLGLRLDLGELNRMMREFLE
jgi:hypothetical protein